MDNSTPKTPRPQRPIVVIDDEPHILMAVDTTLRMSGLNHVVTCADSREALAILQNKGASVVLLDLNMPHLNGRALMPRILEAFPDLPIIIITGTIDVETAVQSMKSGAFDYIVKPVEESRLVTAIHQALRFGELRRENLALRQHLLNGSLKHPEAFEDIVTHSPKMIALFHYMESIAPSTQPVLIRGETGVGKELAARAIHRLSGRKGKFVPVNVAGLDDNVFSDTLFGHVRGAFTGADTPRKGLIEQAAGGTLFLDEIGDLNHGAQVKLLRLLQEHEYMPLGSDVTQTSDTRVMASTHADLWSLKQQNKFRNDLHYRLRTHRVMIPPLRDRKEDLPLLCDHFLSQAAEALSKTKPSLAPELTKLLESYDYPGNVRELQAMIFDALAQHRTGHLGSSSFRIHMQRTRAAQSTAPAHEDPSPDAVAFGEPLPTIRQATRMLVQEALRRTGNNQSQAANLLGITQQALNKRLRNWNKQKS
jgi:DNA-binding NtrC family response regulator